MGISTNAYFAYGFAVDDESADHEKVADYLAIDDETDYDEPSSLTKLEENYNITIIEHGSGDEPLYIVAVASTFIGAGRGYPKLIEPKTISGLKQKEADKLLQRAAEHLGITCSKPMWVLASYWDV